MASSGAFDLPSGRRLNLRELRQYGTYAGMLEGLPTAELNQKILKSLVSEHHGNPDGKPFLIQPRERRIKVDQPYPFGTPVALPSITCIGRFESLDPSERMGSEFSRLVVIWLQAEFAFPIDPAVLDQLLAIDWESHATSFYF